jgi:hypothetical protein
MRHLRIFEAEERNYWPVNQIEPKVSNYDEPTENELRKIMDICKRVGIIGQISDGVSFHLIQGEDLHYYVPSGNGHATCPICQNDLYVECPKCKGNTGSECDFCRDGDGEMPCPHSLSTFSKSYSWLNRQLVLSVDRLLDDYWQLTLRMLDWNDKDVPFLSGIILRCDGMRGLEMAIESVVRPNIERMDGANHPWLSDVRIGVTTTG